MTVEKNDWVQAALEQRREVCANLDQDPNFAEHCGTMLPVVIASVTDMYGLQAGFLQRKVARLKIQLLVLGSHTWAHLAPKATPWGALSFSQQRKMAGNSFHQACSNGMMTFSMATSAVVQTSDDK